MNAWMQGGKAARHVDTKLQTRLTSKGPQKRLLELYYDARTLKEEQGVNILYLALGPLKWVDPQNAANIRYAPLVLVPVSLERGNAGEKLKLWVRAEEFASNLSLAAYLDRVHGIRLPTFEASSIRKSSTRCAPRWSSAGAPESPATRRAAGAGSIFYLA